MANGLAQMLGGRGLSMAPSGQTRFDPRQQALAMMLQGASSNAPVRHPLEGVARLAQAWAAKRIGNELQGEQDAAKSNLAQALMAAQTGQKEFRNPDDPSQVLLPGIAPGVGAATDVLSRNETNAPMAANIQLQQAMQDPPKPDLRNVGNQIVNVTDPTNPQVVFEGPEKEQKRDLRAIGGQMVDFTDPANPKVVFEAPEEAPKPDFDPKDLRANEDKLRSEFTKASKPFVEVRAAFENIQNAALNPSAAGDLSLVIGYMKLLDPGSVVRESEFATAENAGGVPDKIRATYNKIKSGERLSEDQRADFIAQSRRLFGGYQQRQAERTAEFSRLAKQRNLDPSAVIVDFGGKEGTLSNPRRGVTAEQSQNLPSGTHYIGTDGNLYVVE